jgi:hypothetical protein
VLHDIGGDKHCAVNAKSLSIGHFRGTTGQANENYRSTRKKTDPSRHEQRPVLEAKESSPSITNKDLKTESQDHRDTGSPSSAFGVAVNRNQQKKLF